LRGDYGDAWEDHEARRRVRDGRFERGFPYPEWRGEPLAGRNILIHAEQGLGDEIMFASCISDLIEQGARCVIECDPRLAAIYARSFPQAVVHGARRDEDRNWLAQEPAIEVQVAVGTLPRYLRKSRSDFPRRDAYLTADAERAAAWRERLAAQGGKLKVGISWLGGTAKTRSGMRSIPLEQWLPVLRLKNVQFVSLQHGMEASPRIEPGPDVVVHQFPDASTSLDETAALTTALDLVVTVDNTVAHLAGALGRPVYVLLPASPDWRWLWEGEAVPWYPSARAYRQGRGEGWAPVVASVAAEIARHAARVSTG